MTKNVKKMHKDILDFKQVVPEIFTFMHFSICCLCCPGFGPVYKRNETLFTDPYFVVFIAKCEIEHELKNLYCKIQLLQGNISASWVICTCAV